MTVSTTHQIRRVPFKLCKAGQGEGVLVTPEGWHSKAPMVKGSGVIPAGSRSEGLGSDVLRVCSCGKRMTYHRSYAPAVYVCRSCKNALPGAEMVGEGR